MHAYKHFEAIFFDHQNIKIIHRTVKCMYSSKSELEFHEYFTKKHFSPSDVLKMLVYMHSETYFSGQVLDPRPRNACIVANTNTGFGDNRLKTTLQFWNPFLNILIYKDYVRGDAVVSLVPCDEVNVKVNLVIS